jgi:MarR family transcriptional regulator, transcriptional regulator for hemolysin
MMRRRRKLLRQRIICKLSYHSLMPDRQLLLKAATTSGYVGQLVERNLRAVGLPAFLLPTLTHIRDREPVPPSEISAAAGIPITTLRDNLQRLVDRKLVRRTPNPEDGRSYLLRLTARGHAVVEAGGEALHDTYLALERHLPRPLTTYERALDELNRSLERVLDDD